jgi:hypothetical protein
MNAASSLLNHASRRTDSFQRTAFRYDHRNDLYVCPGGKHLVQHRRDYVSPRPGVDKDGFMRYRASQHDCQSCALKPQCCPRPTPMSHPGASGDMGLLAARGIDEFDRAKV